MKTDRWTRHQVDALWLMLSVLLVIVLLGGCVRSADAVSTASPYRGQWSAVKKYEPGEIVAYRGWTWIAKRKIVRKRCRAVAPHPRKEGLPHCWHRLAKHGRHGRNGAAGQRGANGRDGANGKDGAAGRNGTDGRHGADGVSGYEKVSDQGVDVPMPEGDLLVVAVECPPGKVMLGSGQYHDGLTDVQVGGSQHGVFLSGTSSGLVSWHLWVTCARVR